MSEPTEREYLEGLRYEDKFGSAPESRVVARADLLKLSAIRKRWHTYYDRSAGDYTDQGCRILAQHAFRDIPWLLALVDALSTEDAKRPTPECGDKNPHGPHEFIRGARRFDCLGGPVPDREGQ